MRRCHDHFVTRSITPDAFPQARFDSPTREYPTGFESGRPGISTVEKLLAELSESTDAESTVREVEVHRDSRSEPLGMILAEKQDKRGRECSTVTSVLVSAPAARAGVSMPSIYRNIVGPDGPRHCSALCAAQRILAQKPLLSDVFSHTG